MIENYDPNNRFGKHVISVTFQKWNYRKTVEVTLNGNSTGFDIFSAAVDRACEELYEHGATLGSEAGESMECDPGDCGWGMAVVGVEIKSFTKGG